MSEKSKIQLKKQFKKFYFENVRYKLSDYENKRKAHVPLKILGYLVVLSFVMCVIFPMVGVMFLFIFLFLMIILTQVNKEKNIEIDACTDIEMLLKNDLMPKFLAIFGNYTWEKPKNYALISNMTEQEIKRHNETVHPEKRIPDDWKESIYFSENYKKLKKLHILQNNRPIVLDDCFFGQNDEIKVGIMETGTNDSVFSKIIGFLLISFLSGSVIMPVSAIIVIPILLITQRIELFFVGIIIHIILTVCLSVFIIKKISCPKGIVISFKFPKKIKGTTFLYENKYTNREIANNKKDGLQKVVLEDVNFNKNYTVYSSSQVEARYLLTTAFIERFNNIKTAFNAKYIRAEFKKGNLYLVMGVNKDLFSMGSSFQKSTYNTFEELFEEFYSVSELAKHLKITQKIGI